VKTSLEEIGTVGILSDKGAVQNVVNVSSSTGGDTDTIESLCKRLLSTQPQSEALLKRLLTRSQRVGAQRAFATIKDRRCSACNMMIATARIQKVKAGEFINCASCMTFLYYDQA
jgi:hypothetical protein